MTIEAHDNTGLHNDNIILKTLQQKSGRSAIERMSGLVFRMDQFLLGLSPGFDSVEGEVFGASTHHGKRIGILVLAMGRYLRLSEEQLISVATCALVHDNALTEYLSAIRPGKYQERNMMLHCVMGEENVTFLPMPSDVTGFVKYHHEFGDLSGPFKTNPLDTPLGAQMIAITDDLDIHYDFSTITEDSLEEIRDIIKQRCGSFYSSVTAEALLAVLDNNLLGQMQDYCVDHYFAKSMPKWVVSKPSTELMQISQIVARITDYKSKFTAKHSTQIANRAYWMAQYYEMDEETCARVYIAAACHDIGKLITPTKILEKPGKLTSEEFEIIKDHVYWSYIMLKDVEGFEEICLWAVTHHRKLDGTGYPDFPDGYLTNDFVCRMMACIDIYQAVRETRPYHEGRTHEQTMEIMWDMANRGQIDKDITRDLDTEMAQFTEGDGDVPDPNTKAFSFS